MQPFNRNTSHTKTLIHKFSKLCRSARPFINTFQSKFVEGLEVQRIYVAAAQSLKVAWRIQAYFIRGK